MEEELIEELLEKENFNPVVMEDLSENDIKSGQKTIKEIKVNSKKAIKRVGTQNNQGETNMPEENTTQQADNVQVVADTASQQATQDNQQAQSANQTGPQAQTAAQAPQTGTQTPNQATQGVNTGSTAHAGNTASSYGQTGMFGNHQNLRSALNGIWTISSGIDTDDDVDVTAGSAGKVTLPESQKYAITLYYRPSTNKDHKYRTIEDEIFNRIFNDFTKDFKKVSLQKRGILNKFFDKGHTYEAALEIEVPSTTNVKKMFSGDFKLVKVKKLEKPMSRS